MTTRRLIAPLTILLLALAWTQTAGATVLVDDVPRVSIWWGKVNQHFDVEQGSWQTDPDGRSGANIPLLSYCRRWYPETRSVRRFTRETIRTWRAAGNRGRYRSTRWSYECVQPTEAASVRQRPRTEVLDPWAKPPVRQRPPRFRVRPGDLRSPFSPR